MVKVNFGMLMEIFLKESGKMIKQMVLEFIPIQTVLIILVFGKMIFSMGKGRNIGLMGVNISEIIIWGKKMEKVNIGGLMAVIIMGTGKIIKLKVKERIFGQMEESILGDGKTTICTVLDSIFGMMEENMKACIKMIKNMDLVVTHGLTAVSMMVIGTKENNMGKGSTYYLMEQ